MENTFDQNNCFINRPCDSSDIMFFITAQNEYLIITHTKFVYTCDLFQCLFYGLLHCQFAQYILFIPSAHFHGNNRIYCICKFQLQIINLTLQLIFIHFFCYQASKKLLPQKRKALYIGMFQPGTVHFFIVFFIEFFVHLHKKILHLLIVDGFHNIFRYPITDCESCIFKIIPSGE